MGILAAAAAALVAVVTAASAGEITIVERRAIPVERVQGTVDSRELTLFLYVFKGGRWDGAKAAGAVLGAARLLRQCNVALSHLQVNVIEAPSRFRHYVTETSRELVRQLPVSKPAIFFVDDTLNDPPYDAEAIGRANATTRPELADTVWVAHGARDLPIALAHELVHVLSDSGEHSEEPGNLMGVATSPQATRLTAEQCGQLRARAGANGLLRRSAAVQ
jgi:hypothetical protein